MATSYGWNCEERIGPDAFFVDSTAEVEHFERIRAASDRAFVVESLREVRAMMPPEPWALPACAAQQDGDVLVPERARSSNAAR